MFPTVIIKEKWEIRRNKVSWRLVSILGLSQIFGPQPSGILPLHPDIILKLSFWNRTSPATPPSETRQRQNKTKQNNTTKTHNHVRNIHMHPKLLLGIWVECFSSLSLSVFARSKYFKKHLLDLSVFTWCLFFLIIKAMGAYYKTLKCYRNLTDDNPL